MVKAQCKTSFDEGKVAKPAKRANMTSVGHAAGYIRKVARHSIRTSAKYARPGRPPNTRKGQLRQGINFAVEKELVVSAVIGPSANVVGTSGKAHEFGGRYKKQNYPRRPFMGPALEEVRPQLPSFWKGSVTPGVGA